MAELLKMINLWASDLGVLFILAFTVLLVTQIVKQPIKLLFKKIIKNEKVLDRVCAIIILLPLGFGILADYIMSLYTDLAFDISKQILSREVTDEDNMRIADSFFAEFNAK